MSKQQKQVALLTALLALFAVVVLRPFVRSGGGVGATPGAGVLAALDPDRPSEVELLNLELLERKPATFSPDRDPFRFEVARRPPPPPPPRPAPRPAQQRPVEQRPAPAQPAGPQPPPVDFTYLGSFGPDGGRIAVFTDRAEIYNARVGEVVKEKFVVRGIGYESADIGFLDFPKEPPRRLAIGG
ncbi:MAG: hypothetical protein R3325_01575 [Thermoanaerobaculia bacterium]|nr:hypothetical protein [Thermoanaerobaculia bacterium]